MIETISNYREKVAFNPERFNPVVIAQNERVKVILVCLETGQFIPAHSPKVDLTLYVLEGKGTLIAGSKEENIRPGGIAFIPAGEKRGLKVQTRLVALHIVTPPPTEADHTEVAAKLKKGSWK